MAKPKFVMDMTPEQLDAEIERLCSREVYPIDAQPEPTESAEDTKRAFTLDSQFLVRVECSNCGEIAEDMADLTVVDLNALQKRFRSHLYHEGWRRILDEGMPEDFCPDCCRELQCP